MESQEIDDYWFLGLVYAAELNTAEDPELMEVARELVDEDPETRSAAIEELRNMVYERGECSPRRLDDAFLLRFLRARRFVVRRAHRLLVRYCQFLEQYPELYRGVSLWPLAAVGDVFEGINVVCPEVGRVVVVRFGIWDPDRISVEDLAKAALAHIEIVLRLPKLQVVGFTVIMDLEGVTMRHVSTITPTVIYQMVCILGLSFPIRPNAIHFINYNWILQPVFLLLRRYLTMQVPKYFHGHDCHSLHQHIPRECLPPRLGGVCREHYHSTFGHWLNKYKELRGQDFDEDMKEFGYIIKE